MTLIKKKRSILNGVVEFWDKEKSQVNVRVAQNVLKQFQVQFRKVVQYQQSQIPLHE